MHALFSSPDFDVHYHGNRQAFCRITLRKSRIKKENRHEFDKYSDFVFENNVGTSANGDNCSSGLIIF